MPVRARGATTMAQYDAEAGPGGSDLAAAIRYARPRWERPVAIGDDGRLEMALANRDREP